MSKTDFASKDLKDRVEDLEDNKTGFINVNSRHDLLVGTPITVSYDAWAYLHLYMQPSQTLKLFINNVKVYEYYDFSSAANANALFPLKKGQTISVTSTDTSQTGNQAGAIFRMI